MNFYPPSPESPHAGPYYTPSTPAATAASASADTVSASSTSRPSSASPSYLAAYQQLYKLKGQNSGRGFDADDDLDFCPALKPMATHVPYSPPSMMASPISSAGAGASGSLSGTMYAQSMGSATPSLATRTRKAIEIIDPITGMRVR